MIILVYALMAWCFIGAIQALWNIKTVTLAQKNLNNIWYLIQGNHISDIQYNVYMKEFEDDGYKNRAAMINLARELEDIHANVVEQRG